MALSSFGEFFRRSNDTRSDGFGPRWSDFGVIITEAGNNAHVKNLVYVAALQPDIVIRFSRLRNEFISRCRYVKYAAKS